MTGETIPPKNAIVRLPVGNSNGRSLMTTVRYSLDTVFPTSRTAN